ncbi:MAG: DNA translocase FtsK 4TM domain-containing protein [Thermodesulfobacteriota bacterium]
MARNDRKQERPPLGQEIASVLGIFAALFLLLCFVSYSLPQPGMVTPPNWGGALGGFIGRVFLGAFGLTALWFPALLLILALRAFSPRFSLEDVPPMVLGATGILLASSGLLGLLAADGLAAIGNRLYPVAGHLGLLIHGFAAEFFGTAGALLAYLTLLLVSLMVILDFSPYALFLRLREGRDEVAVEPAPRTEVKAVEPPPDETDEEAIPSVHEPVRLPLRTEEEFEPRPVARGAYQLPSLALLDKSEQHDLAVDRDYYYKVSKELEENLKNFGVEGKVVGISPGPIITTYEFAPAPGVKINKIVGLADDLTLALKAESVRIVGSIPGKAALGIEIPNPARQTVSLRDILAHEKFQKAESRLVMGLGMDVIGNPVVADLARMPHLLIAGATGSGKSVAVNTIITSILYKATPEEVRFLLVDPKRIELSSYEAIPHLLHPVVVDPKMASRALLWAVREMERRYQIMEEARVKSLASYNASAEVKLPLIVIIIDELADLMMVSSREVEDAVARLAQMARAAGMHLILATQRPSVDVLTGLIKANFPTRMSFKVSSKVDSRTILDTVGAEYLLGAGDMLFLPPGSAKLQRIHGAYISEQEIARVVGFLKEQGAAEYDESVLALAAEPDGSGEGGAEEFDDRYDEAVAIVTETGQASISMLQRRLRVGYNRAARMIETMEREGVVGPADGAKPREVLVRSHS